MEFPTLYTLTSSNGVRYWKISVTNEAAGVFLCREYGKYGGKPIINRKLITETKSQTTVYEQAIFEARKDWTEMVKRLPSLRKRKKKPSSGRIHPTFCCAKKKNN